MQRIIWIASAIAAVIASPVRAQDVVPDGHKFSTDRAAVYAQVLGLDAHTTERFAKVFATADETVAPLVAERATIDAKVADLMAPLDAQAEEMLTKEQRAKLEALKKEGKWDPAATVCSPAEAKAGCGDHGKDAAAGGCCAGKAGAKAAAPSKAATGTVAQ